jgi:hypothetical protein
MKKETFKKRVAEKRELINHQIKSNNNQFKPDNKKSQEIYFFYRIQGGYYDI